MAKGEQIMKNEEGTKYKNIRSIGNWRITATMKK